jgi:hypothetical protein
MAGPVDLNDPAFADFNRILFTTGDQTYNHMVDQYFGFRASVNSGNGVFILENAFRGTQYVNNVLENSYATNGQYEGQKLTPGAFLSANLNYEADKIVFCYTDRGGGGDWSINNCYHLFTVDLYGNNLTQLTYGDKSDIHPAFLPDGDIIFISERRGGDGRCHMRVNPTYSLHRMEADGSNIRCVSYHETNEWWPSVTNNGEIAYTRWDYVDRGATHTHSAWITQTDGLNAKQLVLNYTNMGGTNWNKGYVPMMQMQLRQIPDTNKFVATAAPHHWKCYGAIIIIDPEIEDDDRMSTITRITDDNNFPESNGGGHKYGAPFPLTEEFFLVSYSPTDTGSWDLYAIDTAQNKTLLLNPGTPSVMTPIAVKAQPKPIAFYPSTDPGGDPGDAIVNLVDVYNSLIPFPGGTTITHLRIWEPMVKCSSYSNNPRPSYESTESDWAGRNIKALLGTVPVESDGSARFYLPTNRPVLFQALNSDGLAVQSMRSDTFIMHGQNQLVCSGCHEPRWQASVNPPSRPIAFTRAASTITPDPVLLDDSQQPSEFFSYPRYIQPILDNKCISCHGGSQAPDLRVGTLNAEGWSESYVNLKPYVFLFQSKYPGSNWDKVYPRTEPGEYGANDCALYTRLNSGHGSLNADELHTFIIWLDSGIGQYYGAYTDTAGQNNGNIVLPTYH